MNHGVIAIIGSGKMFKSGTLYSILWSCPSLRSRPKAFYKFPDVSVLFADLPGCYSVSDFNDVEVGSVLIIEDANRLFPSRASAKGVILQEFLGVISHKDILVCITVQNTANTDVAFFRDQDVIMIHKRMFPIAITQERPEFQATCSFANHMIDSAYEYLGGRVSKFYLSYVPRFSTVLSLEDPPSWYGYDQSHAFRHYRIDSSSDKSKKGDA